MLRIERVSWAYYNNLLLSPGIQLHKFFHADPTAKLLEPTSTERLREDVAQLQLSANELDVDQCGGMAPQDVGRTIGGGPAHKIKACTALLGVYRKTLYSTK